MTFKIEWHCFWKSWIFFYFRTPSPPYWKIPTFFFEHFPNSSWDILATCCHWTVRAKMRWLTAVSSQPTTNWEQSLPSSAQTELVITSVYPTNHPPSHQLNHPAWQVWMTQNRPILRKQKHQNYFGLSLSQLRLLMLCNLLASKICTLSFIFCLKVKKLRFYERQNLWEAIQ